MAAINVYCSSAAPSAAPDIRLWLLWRSDDWCNHPVFSQQALNFIQKMCMEMYKKKNNNVGTLLQNIGANTRLNIIIMEHDTSDNSLRTRRAYLSCRKNNAGRFSVLRLDTSLWSVQEASDRICKALTVPDNLYQTSPPIKGANKISPPIVGEDESGFNHLQTPAVWAQLDSGVHMLEQRSGTRPRPVRWTDQNSSSSVSAVTLSDWAFLQQHHRRTAQNRLNGNIPVNCLTHLL